MNEITDLRTAAVALNEMFVSFLAAGFTRREALELTKVALAHSMNGKP